MALAVCFYLLTGAHGLHIIAGLVPLHIVLFRAFLGRYTAPKSASGDASPPRAPDGVRDCARFWHFLAIVWLVMFAVLKLGG